MRPVDLQTGIPKAPEVARAKRLQEESGRARQALLQAALARSIRRAQRRVGRGTAARGGRIQDRPDRQHHGNSPPPRDPEARRRQLEPGQEGEEDKGKILDIHCL